MANKFTCSTFLPSAVWRAFAFDSFDTKRIVWIEVDTPLFGMHHVQGTGYAKALHPSVARRMTDSWN